MTARNPFPVIYLEITGGCNAKCPWCATGRSVGGTGPKRYIEVELFARALDRLLDIGAVLTGQTIGLYNWGEPTLHPRLYEILEELGQRGLYADINSNGSIPPKPSKSQSLRHIANMSFSLPGFSQQSQDRIHGFDFERVLRNIDLWIKTLEEAGNPGKIWINFHLYQFSIDEFHPAGNYFWSRYGVKTFPSTAYIADWRLCMDYLNNRMDPATLKKMSSELLLHYVDDLIAGQPKDFSCPQFNWLTIDENCQVVLCCTLPADHEQYHLGSLFDLSLKQIRAAKRSRPVCGECIKDGAAYWSLSAPVPEIFRR